MLTAIDTYTAFMAEMFDDNDMLAVDTGFQSFFGDPMAGGRTTFLEATETFEYDIIRGDKTISIMVPRGITGELLEQKKTVIGKSSNFRRSFPLSVDNGVIQANQLLKRLPGEGTYNRMTKEERLTILAFKMHMKHMRKKIGLHELLAATSMITGEMPAILGTTNPDEIYDFRRNPDNEVTPLVAFNDEGADILGTADESLDLIQRNGKIMGDMWLMGGQVADAYLNDPIIDKWHQKRGLNLGSVDEATNMPERFQRFTRDGGFSFMGTVRTPKNRKIWIFTSDAFYVDPFTGLETLYMPEDEAIMTSSRARFDRFFGPSERLPMTSLDRIWMQEMFGFSDVDMPMPANLPAGQLFDSRMFHFSAEQGGRKFVKLRTESAPVYVPTHTDAISRQTGLITPP